MNLIANSKRAEVSAHNSQDEPELRAASNKAAEVCRYLGIDSTIATAKELHVQGDVWLQAGGFQGYKDA